MQLISIVITAYNVGKTIAKAVQSALSQTYKDIEVIVVEDYSTDDTLEVLKSIENTQGALKIIRNESNQGAGMSRRIGIAAASGEYVLTLDGDDYLEGDFIESLVNGGDDADIISGSITVICIDGKKKVYVYDEHETTGSDKIEQFFKEKVIFINNKLIRRKLYDEHPYSTRRFIEDTPTMVPLLYLANKVKYVSNPGYNYVLRKESLTHQANPTKYAIFHGLCMKSFIEWAADKPRAYRDLFRRGFVLKCGQDIMARPKEEIIAVAKEYHDEWKEFLDYLAFIEELKFSILEVPEK